MAVSSERASFDTARAIKQIMRASELAPAHVVSQLATYAEIVLAIALACALLDTPATSVVLALALGAGAVVSNVTPVGGLFTNVSGFAAALCAMFLTLVIGVFSDRLLSEDPWIVLWVVGLGVLGLDWRFAPRLRARVVGSGAVIVPLVGADERWAYPAAVAWFLGALGTLWLIERDVRRAATRPVPLVPTPARSTMPGDLVRTAAIGLLAGLAVALLLADVTCTWNRDSAVETGTPGSLPDLGGGNAGDPRGLAPEHLFRVDPDTGGLVPDGRAADRIPVPGTGGRPVGRDQQGRAVVRQPDGSSLTYDRDASGRDVVIVDDADGRRTYVYEDEGDRLRITEHDESGAPVREYLYEAGDEAGSAPGSTVPRDAAAGDTDRSWWPWILAAIVVAAIAVVVAMLWRPRDRARAPAPRSWAEALADRLDEEGRRRGRGRAEAETVVDHADALADGPLPDDRLTTVGRIVSAALFGRATPPDDTRAWAESVVDDVSAANPPASRHHRRSGG
jgi:hypothetical protein